MTLGGLVTFPVLLVIELATRAVPIAGITTNPNEPWMMHVARNLTDAVDGFLRRMCHLLLDRDAKYSAAFRCPLQDHGIEIIRLPPRSPNLNAFAERFVGSIKEECLNRIIFLGAGSLRHAVREYMAHYHVERNHQGMGNRLLKPVTAAPPRPQGSVSQRQRLGGMLNYYYRKAA
ncbi:integrase core domain-containing protein [Metallibacterium sp.]